MNMIEQSFNRMRWNKATNMISDRRTASRTIDKILFPEQ
jgi:hypothetical protein